MNAWHLEYLASAEWEERLRSDLLPWIESFGDLGDEGLEVGPGPGLTTDLLRERFTKLTAVELDDALAKQLTARLSGTNVSVVQGDAANTGLPADSFDAAMCFTMLHHVPAPSLQDEIFAELQRVLKPGGKLLGQDSRDSELIRQGHIDDIFVPIDPETLEARLRSAGFRGVDVDVREHDVRFVATK